MSLIYTEQTSDFKKGNQYRNPRYWSGEVEAAKGDDVEVIGDFPKIVEAYEGIGAKVKVTKVKAEKVEAKKNK